MPRLIRLAALFPFAVMQSGFQAMPDSAELYREEVRAWIARLPDSGQYSWPRPTTESAFANSQLPAAVRMHAETWIRRVVRPEHLPADLQQRFHGARLPKADWIFVRFSTPSGLKLQILESGWAVVVTVQQPGPHEAVSISEARQFVRSTIGGLLQIPNGRFSDDSVSLREANGLAAGSLFRGTARAEGAAGSNTVREWWEKFDVLNDRNTFSFCITESPRESGAAGGGHANAGRFGNRT